MKRIKYIETFEIYTTFTFWYYFTCVLSQSFNKLFRMVIQILAQQQRRRLSNGAKTEIILDFACNTRS